MDSDIVKAGELCDGVYMVFRGPVVVYLKSRGEEVELDWLGKGSVIG